MTKAHRILLLYPLLGWLFPALAACSGGSGSKGAVEDAGEPDPCEGIVAPEPPDIEGLAGYYPMACSLLDQSQEANHGTVFGAEYTTDRFGNPRQALHLDGKGDYVALASSGIGTSTHSFTVALWFRTETKYKSGLYFEGVLDGPAIFVRVDPQGGRLLAHSNDHFQTLKTDKPYNDGAWHHVALVGAENNVTLWVDGKPMAEGEWLEDEDSPSMKDTKEPTVLGREGQPDVKKASNYFEGDLDDIAIVRRPLSAKEIVELYKAGPNQLPNAVIVPTVLGLQVKLDGSGSFDPDGKVVSHEWDFGDGSAKETAPTAVHEYAKGGIYAITLTVADDEGAVSTSMAIVDAFDPSVHTGEGSWPEEWAKWEQDVLALTNERRAAGAVCGGEPFGKAGPLEWNKYVTISARLHSEDMAKNAYFSHTGMNGSSPFDRMAAAGYAGPYPWGENIAAGQTSPGQVVEGWMNSPGHCRNIMNPGYGVLGVGYYRSDSSPMKHYWTQNFGGGH